MSPTRSRISSRRGAAGVDVAIVEIGGTVGDIESLPFLEAVRQMSLRAGPNNAAFVHLTYVPWIAAAGELKTKPTQHTVQKMREIGIQPDVLLCRADREVPRRGARQDHPVHERAAARRDLHVGRRHDLQGAAHAARAGPGRADLHEAAVADPAGRPAALGHPGARGGAPAHQVQIGDVRQVHRPVGQLQVAQRGAAPRRHPQPRQGRDRVRRLRDADAGDRRAGWPTSTPSWCRAASASAASRARSWPRSTRANTACPTSASAWACRWRRSSTRATWPAWTAPTAPSSTPRRRTR